MEDNIVKTINGHEISESLCRKIKNEYYLIGNINIENSGDIYLINNRYIRFNTNRLIYDHLERTYKLNNETIIRGIVDFKDEQLVYGHFTKNDLYNCKLYLKDSTEVILHPCIFYNKRQYKYRKCKSDGNFYEISMLPTSEFNKIRFVDKKIKESYPYDSKGITDKYMKIYNNNYNPIITKEVSAYYKSLKDYTFGFEFETTKGIIPNNKLNVLPLIPLRDGSIEGLEYVTVPLSGDKGLQALIDVVSELKNKTEYNISCSTHLHIGNIPRTPEFILAFYKLISYFQDDIFELFPLYKKYNFAVKRKNYSQPFSTKDLNFKMDHIINNDKQIISNFNVLFRYLSEGKDFSQYDNDLKNVDVHPRDPQSNQKWNIHTRYHFINFIPLIFGNKQTIEFRIHTPTYDINKLILFLLLNVFLIDFVKKNSSKLLSEPGIYENHSLIDFVANYASFNSVLKKELVRYLSVRRDITASHNAKGKINYSEEDFYYSKSINWKSFSLNNNLFNKEIPEPLKDFWKEHTEELNAIRRQKNTKRGVGIIEQIEKASYYKATPVEQVRVTKSYDKSNGVDLSDNIRIHYIGQINEDDKYIPKKDTNIKIVDTSNLVDEKGDHYWSFLDNDKSTQIAERLIEKEYREKINNPTISHINNYHNVIEIIEKEVDNRNLHAEKWLSDSTNLPI